jgi:hypothetical protein
MSGPYSNANFPRRYNPKESVLRNSIRQGEELDQANYDHNNIKKTQLAEGALDVLKDITPSIDNIARVVTKNTEDAGRKTTPTKEEQQLAKINLMAVQKNIQIEKSGDNYRVFQNNTLIATMAGIGFLIVFLMALLFPKMNHGSQNAGSASRKNKKSSRRNRK